MESSKLTEASLGQFTGSESLYRHWLPRTVMTEGAKYLADNGASWLIDVVASHQCNRKVRAEPFQCWRLKKCKTKPDAALITCTDGNDTRLCSQRIPYTDFPNEEQKLFAVWNGEQRVIMLPSEY